MKYLLYLFLGLCFPLFSFGQIQLEPDMEAVNLKGNMHVTAIFTDKKESFESIRKKDFTHLFEESYVPGNENVLWLKFEVVNLEAKTKDYFFYSYTAFYDVYQQTDTGWVNSKNGYLMPLKDRTNKKSRGFTALRLKPFQVTRFYVRLQSGKLTVARNNPKIGGKVFYFEQLYQQQEYNRPSTTFTLIYFSGLLMISFFILILYFSIRDSVYLYYLLYLFFQLIYSLIIFARTPLKFMNLALYYPSVGYVISETIQFIFIGFYIIFIMHLLEINKKGTLGRFMKSVSWLCFIYAAFSLFFYIFFPSPEGRGFLFILIRSIILPINLILIVWIALRIKHPLIPYFLVGNLFFFFGSVLSVTVSYLELNQDPESVFYFGNSLNTLFQMGLLGEVFCFSFALAHRVRLIQKEKENSTSAIIAQLQENKMIQERMNKELDKKINQKTEELIRVYSDIEKQREKEIKLEFSQKINEMETMALRTQMNPHFLFNSMNAIKHLIMTDRPEDAMYYLDDFSSLLRSVLQNSKRNTITVEDELEILELYLSLEKGRLGDEFQYEVIVNNHEILSQYPIPGLLLQPFVENAIWHGLSPGNQKEKLLSIKFEEKESLIISIHDNGIGRAASRKLKGGQISSHQSLGLKISQERLALFNHLHDMKINLEITDLEERGKPTGTLITFTYII